MVSPALIDWIKKQELKGYTSQQIYLHLVNNGYDQKDVIEAVNFSNSLSGNYPGSNMQYSNPYQNNNQNNNINQNNIKNHNSTNNSSHAGMWIFLVILIILGGGGFYLYSSGLYVPALDFVSEKLGLESKSNVDTDSNTNSGTSNTDDLSNPIDSSSDSQITVQDTGVQSSNSSNTDSIVINDNPSGTIPEESVDVGEPEVVYTEEPVYDEEIIIS